MAINRRPVGHGVGSDILGDPLNVLSWLANSCAAWGTPLLAGTWSCSARWSRRGGCRPETS